MKEIIILCALLLVTPVLSAQINIDDGSVYTDRPASLRFKQGIFSIESNDERFDIPSYNVRGSVKGLGNDAIESLLSRGDVYFKLDYENRILDSNLRMRGGGEGAWRTYIAPCAYLGLVMIYRAFTQSRTITDMITPLNTAMLFGGGFLAWGCGSTGAGARRSR